MEKLKVVQYNLEFGAHDRFVNILGCFKYKPNGNIYIVYADVDTKYELLHYGGSHIKNNSILKGITISGGEPLCRENIKEVCNFIKDVKKVKKLTEDTYNKLKSAGITAGHVYVTSPVSATGESALAGIMNSYEVVTDVEIPDTVKEAANNEIYTQAEIVKNSDVDADELSKLVDDVKEEVVENNVTDHTTIVNIINNYTINNNINITNSDIENLADSIEQIQNVQGDINSYQSEVSGVFNNTTIIF